MEGIKKVATRHKIFYGIGDVYGGGAFFIIGALFLFFLTDVVGFDPILAGVIIAVGKIWDAVTDPAMGYISDHTRSRFGRRRLYFLIGIVPICVSFMLLWVSVTLDNRWLMFAYYLLTYLLFNTVFTMVMVPYNAMPAEMSKDYAERSGLIAIRMGFSQFGALLGALLPLTIVNAFDDKATGFMVMGIIFSLIFASVFIVVFFGTYETEQKSEPQKVGNFFWICIDLIKEMFSTFRNKSLRVHISMYLCAYVAMDLFNALLIYYLRDYLEKETFYQVLLGFVILFQLSSLFFVAKGCSKNGNAKTYRRHVVIWVLGIVFFGLIGPESPIWMLFVIGAVIGIGLSGGVMIPYNMLAFVVDADEVITTKRREGTYAGMMTFFRKIAQAIALFSIGVYLKVIGYQVSEPILTSTVLGIRLFFVLAPTMLLLIGAYLSNRFNITPENHVILMDEVSRLKSGGSKREVQPETKMVLEEMTGLAYGTLWGGSDD